MFVPYKRRQDYDRDYLKYNMHDWQLHSLAAWSFDCKEIVCLPMCHWIIGELKLILLDGTMVD